jgi:RHH-type proline utilization regulon transcriptional repressor/proline dehydrogenase/delta 1-pyrroline-5-carboxylate dehydrogenase
VLCVQEDIADRVLEMMEGAMCELALGDPRRLATDVGPVIDADAHARLEDHVSAMRQAGHRVVQAARDDGAADAHPSCFMPPTLIDLGGIENLARLTQEVFGPVLHVVRWQRAQLGALVDAINATGYALTHGIHTRIDDTVEAVLARIHAGNVYVNRNMIGAVVGVQPFGGHGLSGTGPKAGGPLYLRRLVRTRVPMRLPPEGKIDLPGPTGELNVLEFRPRGIVACIANDERALRMQARAAQGLGNRVVMLRSHFTTGMRHALDAARLELVDTLDLARVDAVMADLPPERLRGLRAEVLAAERTIIPVLAPSEDGEYDLARLVLERSVAINTAAAGGNAALLALAGHER